MRLTNCWPLSERKETLGKRKGATWAPWWGLDMNEVERRLQSALASGADPKVISPTKIIYKWLPVRGYDHQKRDHGWIRGKLIRFTPLGMFHEYQTYAGSEEEYRDKHGHYSWQLPSGELRR